MAKKKKAQRPQILSPENYIRKKSRSLPILECWINDDWEEGGLASILVARVHANGNVTMAFYLTDLRCLGVKDTYFRFNQSIYEYEEVKEQLGVDFGEYIKVDYALAHNIIYAAWEFASDYDFTPHKDFMSTTRYFLSEDNDDIMLMEIPCGHDDKPHYVRGVNDSDADAKRIIAQLERTAGKGNFTFFDEVFNADILDSSYDSMSLEDRLVLLASKILERDEMSDSDQDDFYSLANSIFYEYVNDEVVDDFANEFVELYQACHFSEEITSKTLGKFSLGAEKDKVIIKQIQKITDEYDDKVALDELEEMKRNYPPHPLVEFIERTLAEVLYKVENVKFPDFPATKLGIVMGELSKCNGEHKVLNMSFKEIFNEFFNSTHIYFPDFIVFVNLITYRSFINEDPDEIAAMQSIVEELRLPVDIMDEIYGANMNNVVMYIMSRNGDFLKNTLVD